MQIQRHARITSIRKVSGYFLLLLSFLMVSMAITGLIFFSIILIKPLGNMTILVFLAKSASNKDFLELLSGGITIELKIFALAMPVLVFGALEFISFHLHQLVSCFYDGDIFNQKAVSHAKKAFIINNCLTAFFLALEALWVMYAFFTIDGGNAGRVGGLMGDMVDALIWIGLILLAIWSLEIGVALNEEAELTI
jgi:hypothetical protein